MKLKQGTVKGKGHYRNWGTSPETEIWIAWRFGGFGTTRKEHPTEDDAIRWLLEDPDDCFVCSDRSCIHCQTFYAKD